MPIGGTAKVPENRWECPECTYRLNKENFKRCGVCAKPKPGLTEEEAGDDVEEEFAEPTKKAVKPASSLVMENVTLSGERARLLVVMGEIMGPIVNEIRRNLESVCDIVLYRLSTNSDEVRSTRDTIINRLKNKKSCIVYDNVCKLERQEAWTKIGGRCGAFVDLAVPSKGHILLKQLIGKAFVLPIPYSVLKELYAKPKPVTLNKPPSLKTSAGSPSKEALPAPAIQIETSSLPPSDGPLRTSVQSSSSSQAPTKAATEIVDLTLDG